MPDEFIHNQNADPFETKLRPLWMSAQGGNSADYRSALALMTQRLRAFFANKLQGLPDEVEDMMQETLIALHNKRGTYDPAYPVSAWMFAIARHKLVDLHRRRGRTEALHDHIDSVDESELASEVAEQSAARDVGQLLNKLPDAQRVAIELTKLEGLSIEEAARQTGSTVAAVKVQVHRGLKALAARLRST
ncbi:sigma-70 family RNA polymerase sigma factor [Limnobacter sp.]|uniref:sigma-70 family RNA polymerase sigma factor n=1 Tax=Limnobacter sp. TaxID=2003368 RepID=UPI00258FFA8D|nr:sigma-70 family RNA polymerase sigma factor [Limnobacter sp.]